MRSRYVVLELLPSRLDVALCDGSRVIASERLAVSLPTEPDAWSLAVRELAPALSAAVDRLRAKGAGVKVFYRSPTQAVVLKSMSVRGAEAREAARLVCLDSLTFPVDQAVCEAAVVASDNVKQEPHNHVAVAADRGDVLDAIVWLVEQSALRFRSAAPIDALLMGKQVVQAVADGDGPSARLYIGEHSSFFLVRESGRLVFARQIRIGVEKIVASLQLPVRRGDVEPVSLTAPAARRILFEHGLPDQGQVVDESLGLTGGEVIPLMQPVLQRLVIELRQSLRFGLSDQQRETLRILLTGPASVLPGFGNLIGDELSVPVVVDTGYASHRWSEPAGAGSQMHDALRHRRLIERLNLLPAEISRERNTKRLCRWLWLGSAAAVLLVAVDAARLHWRIDEARRQADALQTQTVGQEALRKSTARLAAVTMAIRELRGTIRSYVGAKPHYGSVLKEISRLTPQNIRLTGVSLQYRDGQTIGQLSGVTFNDVVEGALGLQPYVVRLGESPLIHEVALGTVQIGTVDERPGQRFDARFRSPLAPVEDAIVEHVVAAPEPRP